MKLDTTIWFIAVFLLYWALNVSIREAMTLEIIQKLARSMINIYFFQLIIIRRIRRCMLFHIYWILICSINIIGFTPFKFIWLKEINKIKNSTMRQWHIRKTLQIHSFIGPQRIRNALYVLILSIIYK